VEKVLGQEQYGAIIMAEMKGNKIESISSGYIEHSDNTYDGNTYFTKSSWGGDYTDFQGRVFKRGEELEENFTPAFQDEGAEQIMLEEDYYHAEGHHCEECGTFHDTEQYYNLSYVITEHGGFYCKTCVPAEELLTEVEDSEDIFRSKDMTGVDLSENFEEVETLFCDSSGFGRPSEPALTKEQAIEATERLIKEHGTLYSGLTGIGQFQVYVTLWKEVS